MKIARQRTKRWAAVSRPLNSATAATLRLPKKMLTLSRSLSARNAAKCTGPEWMVVSGRRAAIPDKYHRTCIAKMDGTSSRNDSVGILSSPLSPDRGHNLYYFQDPEAYHSARYNNTDNSRIAPPLCSVAAARSVFHEWHGCASRFRSSALSSRSTVASCRQYGIAGRLQYSLPGVACTHFAVSEYVFPHSRYPCTAWAGYPDQDVVRWVGGLQFLSSLLLLPALHAIEGVVSFCNYKKA
jgi:hypothetical protein